MKVWVCKTYYSEGNSDEFRIECIFTDKKKADEWKEKRPGYYCEVDERETD